MGRPVWMEMARRDMGERAMVGTEMARTEMVGEDMAGMDMAAMEMVAENMVRRDMAGFLHSWVAAYCQSHSCRRDRGSCQKGRCRRDRGCYHTDSRHKESWEAWRGRTGSLRCTREAQMDRLGLFHLCKGSQQPE